MRTRIAAEGSLKTNLTYFMREDESPPRNLSCSTSSVGLTPQKEKFRDPSPVPESTWDEEGN